MDSRRRILDALRAAAPADVPLPEELGLAARVADPVQAFAAAVQVVGGTALRVTAASLAAEVRALAERIAAKRVACLAPAAGEGNVRLDDLADPHQLEGIDLATMEGSFAVAENGAVWVGTRGLRHRGIFVVAQHLALVVPASEIVNDMHEAYERLSFEGAGFGVFIAGPSKTADIEQSLVIGAHGPRSCTVFLVD